MPFPGTGWAASQGGSFWRAAIGGHGNVPIPECLRVLRRAGHTGVLAIEFEGMEDVLTGPQIDLENLRRSVAMAANG